MGIFGRISLGLKAGKNNSKPKKQRLPLAYRSRKGKRVWLWAEHFGNFQADSSWERTGYQRCLGGRDYDYKGMGNIEKGLPQWVWDVLTESPDLGNDEGVVYLINGKRYQYLYSEFGGHHGGIHLMETFRRVKR